jgi:uncharacterized protein YjbJ (UPF0337 family)
MDKDRAAGARKTVFGKVKEAVGRLFGDQKRSRKARRSRSPARRRTRGAA